MSVAEMVQAMEIIAVCYVHANRECNYFKPTQRKVSRELTTRKMSDNQSTKQTPNNVLDDL